MEIYGKNQVIFWNENSIDFQAGSNKKRHQSVGHRLVRLHQKIREIVMKCSISFQVKARHKNEKFKKQAKLGQNQIAPVADEEDTKIESFDKKRGQSRRVTPIIIVSSC